ncbi:serine protease of Rhomboid family, contains TPR repeats [Niallia nealsonii AAU1]|nr:serine protease of Rhomboid family, contains TPR repeats [Niallia nealsonii AAU1]
MEIEQYKYWRLVDFLVTECQYKIIYLSEDQQEIWLEEQSSAIKYPVIRLFRIDLDWSNWLSRDMERTSINAERIRRTLRNRSLKVESMYITAFPPVDSFAHLIDKPFISADKKVEIKTVLLDRSIEEWS